MAVDTSGRATVHMAFSDAGSRHVVLTGSIDLPPGVVGPPAPPQ
ncbi:hypothetical protein [Euzebya sp.]